MRRATLIALAGVITVAQPAHAQNSEPLFKCGVSDEGATITVVPKNLPPGVAPPQFTRNSVPIPPLLWLSADRHFAEALMLYWRVDDVETKSRFRLLVPFLLDDCQPEQRTTLTPLFGWKRDRAGAAGYILNYYFRRDAKRDSDVLFPFYWRTRLYRDDGTVESSSFGIPPLALRLESPDYTTWITLLGYMRSGAAGWDAALWPLWFGGGSQTGSYSIIPPLVTAWWTDGADHTLIAGPFYDRRVGQKHVGGFVPLWFYERAPGENFTLIPPLLTLITDETTIVGPYYSHAGHRGVVPFFFSGPDYLVIPPLLTLHTDETTIVGPYYSHDGHRGVVPLFFSGPDYLVIPPLLTVHTDETTVVGPYYSHEGHRGVVPFFFSGPNYLIIPPLLTLHRHEPDEILTIAGPFYAWQTTEFEHDGLLPIWMHGRWRDGAHYLLIPPALTLQFGDATSTTTIVGPGYWRRHPEGWDGGIAPLVFAAHHGASQYAIVPPLFMEASEPGRHFVLVPPLLFGRAVDRDHEFTLAGPYYSWQGPDAEHDGLLPLWLHGRWRSGEHYLAIPPALTLQFGDGQTETTIFGPGYWRRHPEGWDAGVAPAAFVAKHGASHYVLIPPAAFLHAGDGENEVTVAGPVFQYGTSKNGDYFLAIPPALTLRYGDATSSTTIVGPGYWRRHREGWDGGLAPILFAAHHDGSQYAIVAPLFFEASEGERHFVLIPPLLFGHAGDRDHELTLAGPYYSWRGPDAEHDGLLPIWLHGHWRSGEHYLAIPPALTLQFGDGKTETTIFGPGYWRKHPEGWDAGLAPAAFVAKHGASHYVLAPPVGFVHAGDGESEVTVAGPVFQYGARKNGDYFLSIPPALTLRYGDAIGSTTIVGPGYWRRHPEGWDGGIAPVFFAAEHGDSRYAVIPPLASLYAADADGELLIAGPLLQYGARKNGEHFFALPLALTLHIADATSDTTIFASGYLHRHPEGWDAGIAPVFFAADHGDSRYALIPPLGMLYAADADGELVIAGPMLQYGARKDGRHFLAIPPALTLLYGDGATETTIFASGYWRRHANGDWDGGIAPLVFAGDHGDSRYALIPPLGALYAADNDGELLIAGPAFQYGARKNGQHFLAIPAALTLNIGDQNTNTTIFANSYWRRHANGDWDGGSAPLVFAGHHGASQYTLLAPPLFMRWSDADSATTLAGPVYVSSSPHSTSVAVAPLAFYRGTDDSTSLTIFPLLHYSATEQSRTVLAPLYYHDSDPTSSHTMVFPFYWNAHDPSGSSRVAFPFYWDFESGDRRITLVPPVALHYRKGDMETNVVGPVAWSWGRTSQGPSWSFHLFPAFSMESARPDHFKWRVLYGLAGRETSGDWHRWQVLYMWTDPSHT